MRGYVYILGDESGRYLYVGVTSDVVKRVWQHRHRVHASSFSARHHTYRLLLVERYRSIVRAIAREKQLKVWRRNKKLALIRRANPDFLDLAERWPDRATSFSTPSHPSLPARPSA
jgi:putative endonuclease